MYADRYAGRGRFNAGGLAAAIGVNAAFVAALMFAAPDWIPELPDRPFGGVVVELDPPPPEPAPPPPPESAPRTERSNPAPDAPRPEVATRIDDAGIITDAVASDPPGEVTGTPTGVGGGEGVAVDPPAPSPPLLVGPSTDPRYVRELQPPYPPSEQRLGNDGRVTVRVRIGADGRVREVRRVSATSDAFFRATEMQALRRWRFRPATRDGVPEEGWRTMTVTFVLED